MLIMNMLMTMLCAANDLQLNPLTPEEERVIIHKGTERPFTGEFNKHYEAGVYHCRRCGTALYRSESKFDSGCGWPAFDDEVPGAVLRTPDPDGHRTEITCARCGAHLGHVFMGEGLTPKNTRHCVNSISLTFTPENQKQPERSSEKAIFAGGCFWGVEFFLQDEPGVLNTRVGYTGGHMEHPTYDQVCRGETGHVEAVEVEYDPQVTSFETLAVHFFETHDPTQVNRQGPDRGEQYRSAIFYLNDAQRDIALALIEKLREKGYAVATSVEKAKPFWPAEDYHQGYYLKKKSRPYCHAYKKRF